MMVTTIQPTNIYKKLLANCCDKNLDRDTCNFLNAYYTVDKHKLFDCKSVASIKLQAQVDIARRNEILEKMKQQIVYIKNYIERLKPRPPQEPLTEAQQKYYDLLLKNNDVNKQEISKYAKTQQLKA